VTTKIDCGKTIMVVRKAGATDDARRELRNIEKRSSKNMNTYPKLKYLQGTAKSKVIKQTRIIQKERRSESKGIISSIPPGRPYQFLPANEKVKGSRWDSVIYS
jgi:hypothetical protein